MTGRAPGRAGEKLAGLTQQPLLCSNNSSAHNWRDVSIATREILVASGKFDVKVSEDAGVLESAASLKRYDLVFLAIHNATTPTLADSAKENPLGFVKGGKGFAALPLN